MSLIPNTTVYQFTPTQDWFSHNIQSWTDLFPLIRSDKPRVLEVGSWEGRSAVFLLNNVCKSGGEIVCIDHFDLLRTSAGQQRYAKIKHNLEVTGKRHRILPQFSIPGLMSLLSEELGSKNPGFDWIYIDGSHRADDTMLDGELAWRLARKDAIIIFDDYHWNKEPEGSIHHPKRGIDAFLALHHGEYERLTDDEHYQVVVRKVAEMRLGFLLEGNHPVDEVMEYEINIALAVNSGYAIGAAVSILSVVERTPGRITLFVIDCGLVRTDKDRFLDIISAQGDRVTLQFLELPDDGLAKAMGPVWAKIDMLGILPVERVLYLDADILVRESVRALWNTDLKGKTIAAAPDVGYPMGHDKDKRRPYFNAGVILVDLSRARQNSTALTQLAKSMKNAKHLDQDALNLHFQNDWLSLDLKWNAQGLGTYAQYPSDDRNALDLNPMKEDPHIVHFTGPVHPTLIEILNPYVQPPTAKPWGYVGSPGHPFESEWWISLEKTSWKVVRTSADWEARNEDMKNRAIEAATRDFLEVLARTNNMKK
ncbi:General stress protein A [Psilocybe cubensis]|uniref:General stress protein A n=2 Tax=Psilocybe cubensis TaxID=181762 RepID=A0ACB8GL09_PSICU|nr:General stress protein A [Psilocybe cubensis]KAH9475744.1 General stress protein A [Psilocybe cubensis]